MDEECEDTDLPEWSVTIPFTGFMEVTVLADSREEAIELGLDKVNEVSLNLDKEHRWDVDHWEYETTTRIVEGNVFYGHVMSADATELR